MDLKIVKKNRNTLLKREDFLLEVIHMEGPTPSKSGIRKKFAAENSLDIDKVELVFVKSRFGQTISKALMRVWDQPQDRLKIEEKAPEQNQEQTEQKEESSEKQEDQETNVEQQLEQNSENLDQPEEIKQEGK